MPTAPFEFDVDELDDYLMSDEAPEASMLISDLDGFLTGIAIGPELIMPSEWLPVVWGGESPEFENEEEAGRILGHIMGRYNEIIHCLAEAPLKLAPIFLQDAKGVEIAADWAEGFMQAVGLRAGAWSQLYADEEACLLMAPILAWLVDDEDGEALEGEKEKLEILRGDPSTFIPEVVAAMDVYWKVRRQGAPPGRKTSPKAGRNDPCPCGSGKKFKKCCGA
ncbi:YecA family protein [Rhodospirillaceae bacterium LM-1]|nr:YecA family protein [Rhodospirillaceae bacterium LM-1]